MDISIALFFVEMLRAGTGAALEALRDAQSRVTAEATAAEPAEAARAEAPLALDRELELAGAAAGVRFIRGVRFLQDPVGPAGPDAPLPGPGSILYGVEEPPPFSVERLAAAGVKVEPGGTFSVQGGATPQSGVPTAPFSVRYRLREYTIIPPTSFAERFTLMVPSPMPATARPMLVVFHKFGASNLDVLQNTDFVRECAMRGWYLVCPLAASKKGFSSIESQMNTEAVLDFVLAVPSLHVDRERIYGVGFSMGGGTVLNYAARHRDPSHAILAAIVNHSGNTSLNDTYMHDPPTRFIFDFWFGDGSTGSADPWKLTRSSVIDFHNMTLAVDPTSDLARNLGSTPLSSWRATDDVITYLPRQNDVLDQHLRVDLGRASDPSYQYTVVPFSGHDWRMLDAAAACDWLGQYTLQHPLSGRTLADFDGVYDHFLVEQDAPGAFTPFDWTCVTASNELHVGATANLRRLTVDLVSAHLSSSQPLDVFTDSADGTGDEIVITRWPAPPSAVTLDGLSTVQWIYDQATNSLRLITVDGVHRAWKVVP